MSINEIPLKEQQQNKRNKTTPTPQLDENPYDYISAILFRYEKPSKP